METKSEILREEIITSQQARMDFLKYKLMAIAILGAVGTGLEGESSTLNENIDYVLCIIPLVCVYVDFLCYHNTLRILVIAKFLKSHKDKYENFVSDLCSSINKKGSKSRILFNMEDYVLFWTSLFSSILLILYGIILSCSKKQDLICFHFNNPKIFVFILFGLLGTALTILSIIQNKKREKLIFNS